MSSTPTHNQRVFAAIGATIAWFALLSQLYLIILNRQASVVETLFRYFGFFTILSNIMVALCLTAITSRKGSFFLRPNVQAAIAVYILVVGIVYNLFLRNLLVLTGLQRVTDELLHAVMPVYYLLFWFVFLNKKALGWQNIFPWLLFPLMYIIWTLIRGSIVQYYPYPFINVLQEGYPSVLTNCFFLTLVFFVSSLFFVGITCWKNGKRVS